MWVSKSIHVLNEFFRSSSACSSLFQGLPSFFIHLWVACRNRISEACVYTGMKCLLFKINSNCGGRQVQTLQDAPWSQRPMFLSSSKSSAGSVGSSCLGRSVLRYYSDLQLIGLGAHKLQKERCWSKVKL